MFQFNELFKATFGVKGKFKANVSKGGFDPELLKACEGKDASDEDPKQWANRLANQIENFWD